MEYFIDKSYSLFYELYIKNNMNTYEIGKVINISNVAVSNWLKKHKIPMRTHSEIMIGRICPMKGKKHSLESRKKNSIAHKKLFSNGYIHPLLNTKASISTRIKQSLAKGGSGILGRRYDKYPNIFYKLKIIIRTRDNFTCQNCNMSDKKHINKLGFGLNIHHIDYNKHNCEQSNLITVCHGCNSRANKDRDYWFAYYTYKLEHRGE